MNFAGGAGTLHMFSAASLFSTYTSLTALITLFQQFYDKFVPEVIRDYISNTIEQWFSKSKLLSPSSFTLVVEKFEDGDYDLDNQVYSACEAYLANKLKSTSLRLKVSRPNKREEVTFKLAQSETYSENFKGIQLQWSFVCDNVPGSNKAEYNKNKYFELSFNPDHKDKVFDTYLPFILEFYNELKKDKKEMKLYSYEGNLSSGWKSVKFNHPFTFDALALETELKSAVIDDLNRFRRRKEFYKKIGRAWKRGYLLYGPPGTGKSSLVAAMANYLRFDIYDLQLSNVVNDGVLRRLLLSTTNRSILVIEDIDCNLGSLASRHTYYDGEDSEEEEEHGKDIKKGLQISLSGLLNFIDGLWSSCGEERIVILTTNHKDRLDPALLRPGRMDMHIHMSYLTMPGFRILASNYLNISEEHHLFGKIEELLQAVNVTPAQVAEELIRSEDADIALSKLVEMLTVKMQEHGAKSERKNQES